MLQDLLGVFEVHTAQKGWRMDLECNMLRFPHPRSGKPTCRFPLSYVTRCRFWGGGIVGPGFGAEDMGVWGWTFSK